MCYNTDTRYMALMDLRVALTVAFVAAAVSIPSMATQESATEASDVGIPVTSPIVQRACGRCHASDDRGRMTRISYQRSTPEGWEQVIRRMVLLNNLEISPEDAREAVRYLATDHGLAPEEVHPAAFEVERRMINYRYEGDPEIQVTCNRCHSFGRVLTQRRTEEEWRLLTAMHRGYYPLVDFQSFRLDGRPAPDETDRRNRVEKAVAHLTTAFPLETPAWTAWSANMRATQLEGTWALVGHEPGQGPVYGEVVVTRVPGAEDAYETSTRFAYPARGLSGTRTGRAVVYTGFQWRGRSEGEDWPDLREVMSLSRDRQELIGRWFTGAYDERGIDVTLRRVGTDPIVTGIAPRAIAAASREVTVELFGSRLPPSLDAARIDLGAGLSVIDVSDTSPTHATLRVRVEPDAAVGTRDLIMLDGGAAVADAVVVFDAVHRVSVQPDTGVARVGGLNFPKGHVRFEARAYHDGPDATLGTEDDLDLGMVDVDWSLEEYAATFGDDDTSFVGTIGSHGVFDPAGDGPNPERSGNRNNIGDVWVVATLTNAPGGGALTTPLRGRAHLLVTVPIYTRRQGGADTP